MRYSTNRSYKDSIALEVDKVIKKLEEENKNDNKFLLKVSNFFSKFFKKT